MDGTETPAAGETDHESSTDVGRRRVLATCTGLAALLPASAALRDEGDGTSNTLTIAGGPRSRVTTYEVTVSDRIVPVAADGSGPPGGVAAEDAVGTGVHRYEFTGDITDARLVGDAEVYVNGWRVDPATFGE
jgi:hypothetical protein